MGVLQEAGLPPLSGGPGVSSDEVLVSVVIASVSGLSTVAACLDALARQEGDVGHEILVVDRCGEETREALRRRFPYAHVIAAEGRASIPALRALGMARARGRLIAILGDHCMVGGTWLQVIRQAHAAGHRVIGGAVEKGSGEGAVGWAAFLCEYARFMLPLHKGVASGVAGSNAVYDRRALEELGPLAREETWEFFLHSRLQERGVAFHCEPELLVSQTKAFGYAEFLFQRYHYSRSFAGMRMAGASAWKRLAYACATPMLPPLLLLRILVAVARKRRSWGPLLRALPVLSTFLLSAAIGEAVGAIRGPGGSLELVM